MDDNTIKYSHPVPPFVRYCSAIIPTMFDDSLSYYEALCALWKWLQDNLVNVVNQNATVTDYYIKIVNELKSYVENYFDNLDVQEEINNKLDAMAADGTLADIMAEYVQTKVDYFYITSESTSDDIKNAFASAKTSVIEFENGSYTYEGNLIITSNTTVNMNGSSLSSTDGGVRIFFYPLDSEATAYEGISNVTFNNGKIGSSIAMMHNSNITFNDIEFLDTATTHALQIAGCKDVKILDCVFDGQVIDDSITSSFETIQLESCTRAGQPYLVDEDSPSYDNYGNLNIVIKNCEFKSGDGVNSRMYIAIGHHSDDDSNHYMNEGITIEGCKFNSVWYSVICPCGFKNSVIRNNEFNVVNQVGEIYVIRFRYLNNNVRIEGNTFTGGSIGITNVNLVGYCEGLQIIDNTFDTEWTTNYSSVELKNWKNVLIEGNTFNRAKQRNIYAGSNSSYTVEGIIIKGNYFNTDNISTVGGQNIFLNYCSKVNIIENNFEKPTSSTNYSVYANSSHSSVIGFANNTLLGIKGYSIDGVTDYSNIQGTEYLIYTQGSAYSALTNQAFSKDVSQFSKLKLTIHKNSDASILSYVEVLPYNVNDKLSNRNYSFYITDGTNSGIANFTINEDGTFNYSSSNSFTLRQVFATN